MRDNIDNLNRIISRWGKAKGMGRGKAFHTMLFWWGLRLALDLCVTPKAVPGCTFHCHEYITGEGVCNHHLLQEPGFRRGQESCFRSFKTWW